MKRTLALITAALITFAATSTAPAQVQVDFGATGNQLLLNGGAPIPLGDTVLLGTFSNSFTFSLTDTFALLMANFTTMATGHIGDDFVGGVNMGDAPPGQLFVQSQFSASLGATGSPLYMWIFNSNNPATATQWSIITNSDSSWTRPADTFATSIDASLPGTFVPAGAIGSIPVNGGNVFLGIAPIPEPSTYFLGLVGGSAMLGALRLRRARSVK